MKTIKKLFASVLAILLTTAVFASPYSDTSTETLRKEIKNKLLKLDLVDYELDDTTIKVQFMVNDRNEIVVLRTDHDELDKLIKLTLNYKKLKDVTVDIKRNSLYSINVKLEKESA